jgi:hypothetical protein
MSATTKSTKKDTRGEGADMYHGTMDQATADAIWRAMSVLAMGIEATISRTLDRAFLQWPNTAETVWDMLNGIMVRAGMGDTDERPWISALENEQSEHEAEATP